jgi:hypothetical protein
LGWRQHQQHWQHRQHQLMHALSFATDLHALNQTPGPVLHSAFAVAKANGSGPTTTALRTEMPRSCQWVVSSGGRMTSMPHRSPKSQVRIFFIFTPCLSDLIMLCP